MAELFSPISIGDLVLKNRVMMAPMENGLAEEGGVVGQRLIRYFVERIKNEVAIAVTGSVACSPEGCGLPRQLRCDDDRYVPGLSRLADAVHEAGGRLGGQIYHAGRQATRAITGLEPIAPSAIPCPVMNDLPREMTRADMDALLDKFGRGAARLRRAGFDLVEVHLAHGYLLFGFLSPFSNRRSDRYGGSLENRLRYPIEVIRRIREEIGPGMALTARLSVDEFVEGGFSFDDAKEVCRAIVLEGIQAISVSAGSYASISSVIQPFSVPRGFLVPYAEEIRKTVPVPVIVAGRINTPEMVEEIVRLGKADMVALGRSLICDPEFVLKMKEGRPEHIRSCVACNQGCADQVILGSTVSCIQNAEAGKEADRCVVGAALKRKVMVVGGGPAGMEACRVAATRGHDVMLVEKDTQLGGRIVAASKAPGKGEFSRITDYLEAEIRRLGVKVLLGAPDPQRALDEFRPDVIVFAAGAEPAVPDIPGIDGRNVATAEDVLKGRREVGQRVAVVGGGLVGVESALFLAARGCSVTLVEMTAEIAADAGPIVRWILLDDLRKKNVAVLAESLACEVCTDGLMVRRGGVTELVAVDTVVIATSYRPVTEGRDRWGRHAVVIGDAVAVRNAASAIHEGYLAAVKI